jgi:hypothetical protein
MSVNAKVPPLVKGAFATLCTKDEYLPGALVVHKGLQDMNSQYPFIVLATETLTEAARDVLKNRGIYVEMISPIYPTDGSYVLSQHDARFAETWTKLR